MLPSTVHDQKIYITSLKGGELNMGEPTKLSAWEAFWYYATVITSLGAAFVLKVIIKKAIIESR